MRKNLNEWWGVQSAKCFLVRKMAYCIVEILLLTSNLEKKLNKKNPLSSLSVIVMLHLVTEHRGLSSCSETSDD